MSIARKKKKGKRFGYDKPGPRQPEPLWMHVDVKRLVNGVIFGILLAVVLTAVVFHRDMPKSWHQAVGNGALFLGACILYSLYFISFENHRVKSPRAIAAVGLITVIPVAAAVWFPELGLPAYWIPVTLAGFVFGISYSERTAVGASFLLCVLVGLALRVTDVEAQLGFHPVDLVVILFAGAAVAGLGCGDIRKRSKLLRVGMISAMVQAALIVAARLKTGESIYMREVLLGLVNGIGSAIIVSAVLPVIESIFKVTTDISLLELSDQNHPLLRRLSLEAPGTYHHSLIVGNLAEAAGESINASSLLLRVGAYYHDVGKVGKPEYFVENEGMQGSMHVNLSPTMSTLIITAHSRDGVELAKEHGLPEAITDMIQQHHGTSLLEFFFHQAEERSDDKDKIDKELFRYPGPKPQTKEAGVLMLADAVEAASRSLPDPTPSRIGRQVKEIVSRRLTDGQLDECDLTLAEVHKVEQTLIRSLTSVFHGRIKYPEPETHNGEAHGRRNRKPATANASEQDGNRSVG